MNRITKRFQDLKNINRKALITYTTLGDPSIEYSKNIILQMIQNGADLIELGIPCANPHLDGETIKKANVRALNNFSNIESIFDMIKEIRNSNSIIPLVILTYQKSILDYGIEKFIKLASISGIDGILSPDLNVDNQKIIKSISKQYSIDLISIVSPDFKPGIEKYIKEASGFLYCISSKNATTGKRSEFTTDFKHYFNFLNKSSNIPKALGFGISNKFQIMQLKNYCDGLIIGSAIVELIEKEENFIKKIGDFVYESRLALD